MRRIFYVCVFVWLGLFCSGSTQGAVVQVSFNFANLLGSGITNKAFKIAPITMPSVSGTNIVLKEPLNITTSNSFAVVGLEPGSYNCTVSTPITPTTFSITVGTTSSVDASTIISVSTNSATGTSAYSMASADARFERHGPSVLTVDQDIGNDATGNPYLHISNAVIAASSGDLVIVKPGLYNENALMKSNLALYFFANAVVSNTVPTNTANGYGIFDDRAPGAAGPFRVDGQGQFIFRNSNPTCPNAFGAVVITNAHTAFSIRGAKLVVSTRNTGFLQALYLQDCAADSYFDFDEATDTFETWNSFNDPNFPDFFDSNANGVYWNKGNAHVHIRNNHFGAGYCLWPDEPASGAANDLDYVGDRMITTNITAIYGRSVSGNYRTWVTCPVIMGASALALSGPGKFYITAQKLAAIGPAASYAVVSSAEGWAHSQKISGPAGWIDRPVNSGFEVPSFEVTAADYEDTGTGTSQPGILNESTNSLVINGGVIHGKANSANLVKQAGTGLTTLNAVTIDARAGGASGWPITLSSNGLRLVSCTILGSSSLTEAIHVTAGRPSFEIVGSLRSTAPLSATAVQSNGWIDLPGGMQTPSTAGWSPTNGSFYPYLATLFIQGTDGVANTNITSPEASILGSGTKGSLTIQPSVWAVDRLFTARPAGQFWTGGSPNITAYFKLGSTIIAQRNFSPLASRTGSGWDAELNFRCLTNGGAGVGAVEAWGWIRPNGNSPFDITNTITILDLTVPLTIGMTSTNSSAAISLISRNCPIFVTP